jgi:hypothetical protein
LSEVHFLATVHAIWRKSDVVNQTACILHLLSQLYNKEQNPVCMQNYEDIRRTGQQARMLDIDHDVCSSLFPLKAIE